MAVCFRMAVKPRRQFPCSCERRKSPLTWSIPLKPAIEIFHRASWAPASWPSHTPALPCYATVASVMNHQVSLHTTCRGNVDVIRTLEVLSFGFCRVHGDVPSAQWRGSTCFNRPGPTKDSSWNRHSEMHNIKKWEGARKMCLRLGITRVGSRARRAKNAAIQVSREQPLLVYSVNEGGRPYQPKWTKNEAIGNHTDPISVQYIENTTSAAVLPVYTSTTESGRPPCSL